MMERSACCGNSSGTTVVWTVALVLLDETRSGVAELTEAELESVVPTAGAWTEMMMSGAGPTSRLARVHVTDVVPLQFHPVPAALTKLTPAGRGSLTRTVEAPSGPALFTLKV